MPEDLFNKLKHILLISPEPWSHVFVSKHHYAIELVHRGHRVYFLNPPDVAHYKQLHVTGSGIENLYIVNYPGQLKGMRFLPAYLRRRMDRRFLQQLESFVGNKIDIIWNFENSRFYDLGFADGRLKIYHQVDLNQNFHVKEASASADICLCTTNFIKKRILPYNKMVFKIHHGVSQEAFSLNQSDVIHEQPIATLVGNLNIPYLDRELLQKLVMENRGVQFDFIGEYNDQQAVYQLLSKFPNVRFTGRVDNRELKNYLTQSDILLVCYKAIEYREQLASPHKMMEYFASGKVIVATYTDEYKEKKHLLVMTDSNEEYMAKFKEVIQNLNFYNSPEKQAQRIAFAQKNSYNNQLNKIKALIRKYVPGKAAC